MKVFNKQSPYSDNKAGDKIAGLIAGWILKAKRHFAKGMGRIFFKLGPSKTKLVVVSACIVMAAYCTIIITYSFKQAGETFSRPAAIKRPMIPAIKPPDQNLKRAESVPISIIRFRKYIDSLSSTAEGIKVRDSLLRHRPGLIDSIKTVESLYGQ